MQPSDAPAARAFHSLVWTGKEALVWGGSASILGGKPLGDGGRYAPRRNRWRALTGGTPPTARFGHAAVWTGKEMWVLGGATQSEGDARADAAAWHPDTGWRGLPDLPAARVFAHAFHTEHGVIVLGGRDARSPKSGGFVRLPLRTPRRRAR